MLFVSPWNRTLDPENTLAPLDQRAFSILFLRFRLYRTWVNKHIDRIFFVFLFCVGTPPPQMQDFYNPSHNLLICKRNDSIVQNYATTITARRSFVTNQRNGRDNYINKLKQSGRFGNSLYRPPGCLN